MKMTISNLPRDLVEDIVSRVPLKHMRKVRLTCKNWNALFKSQSFTKMRIGKEDEAARGTRMIVMMDYNLHLMSIFVNENPTIEFLGKLTCLNEQVKISEVYQCEGLLLCNLKYDDTRVVVWNPYLGQTRWIKTKYLNQVYLYKYAIGYENKENKSCPNHKILRFYRNTTAQVHMFEIYDFDSDSWRTLDVTLDWLIEFEKRGVSLKGNTYWCVGRKKSSYTPLDHIICFDFTRERFGPFMRLPCRVEGYDLVTLSCLREEKLAALVHPFGQYKIEIWITTKIEAEKLSWIKFMTLDWKRCYRNFGSFFIDEEKKVVMSLEGLASYNILWIVGEAGVRILSLGERADRNICSSAYVCSYVPSLVQIKQPARSKRKRKTKESREKR